METLITLVAVVAVAVVVLWAARRLGVGAVQGPLALVGRLPLDQKRAIYLVRVGGQILVVGASEGGLVKLGEISPDEIPAPAPAPTFREVLARAQGRSEAPPPPRKHDPHLDELRAGGTKDGAEDEGFS